MHCQYEQINNVMLMYRLCFTLFLLETLFSLSLAAQRRGIVISADTKLPLRDVAIRWDNREVVKTAWDGTFLIPEKFSRVNFSHPKCEMRFLKHDELTDTIYMLPASRMLAEVVVYGNRKRRPDYVGITATDRQLASAQTAGGSNLLGVLKLLAQPVINKIHRNKELKEARKKQVLDNY